VSGPAAGDAPALAAALRAMGIPCDVEAREALALIATTAAEVSRFGAAPHREAALALAKRHGFTHVAVELGVDAAGARAPVRRD